MEISKEILYDLYINKNLSRGEVRKELNISDYKLRGLLKEYNIFKPISKRREKSVKTNLEKYGVDNPAKSEIVKNKAINTSLKKYGTKYYITSKEVKDKVIKTNIERFGAVNPLSNKDIRDKAKNTMLKRYGKDNFAKTDLYLEKVTKTCQRKYNKNYYLETNALENKIDELKSKESLEKYLLSFNRKLHYIEVAKNLNISYTSAINYIRKYNLDNLVNRKSSYLEDYFEDRLKSITVNYIKHSKSIIPSMEIDFYLPDIRLGIEINDIATHNSTCSFLEINPKHPLYHYSKTKSAIENNIRLINISEIELFDEDKLNIILDIIKNYYISNKVYARNCTIKEVDIKEVKEFLNKNHLQGYSNSTINLGLYSCDNLIEVMTFGKPRFNKKYEYELIRLCTKRGYKVIGGTEKLFKYFLNNYKPKTIISYCDISKFTGDVYAKLGFILEEYTYPNYIWTNYKNIYTRYKTQRSKLDKLFNKEFDKNLSESDIMESMGYLKVYDSGNAKYVYTNKSV